MARRLLPLLLVAVAAGCGSSGSPPGTTSQARTATHASAAKSCAARAKARAVKKLDADLTALRRAAAHPGKDTLAGNAAVNHATDTFLMDVNTAPIDNLAKNRMIDHAAAALLGACEQCFQALEAERPIPAISQGDRGNCAKP